MVIGALRNKIFSNENLKQTARNTNSQVFMQGIFPKEFDKVAMECYSESTEAFKTMFEDATRKGFISLLALQKTSGR